MPRHWFVRSESFEHMDGSVLTLISRFGRVIAGYVDDADGTHHHLTPAQVNFYIQSKSDPEENNAREAP